MFNIWLEYIQPIQPSARTNPRLLIWEKFILLVGFFFSFFIFRQYTTLGEIQGLKTNLQGQPAWPLNQL